MRAIALTPLIGAACLAIAACGDADTTAETTGNGPAATGAADATAAGGGATASANWPRGTRIVEEDGVTFRVDPDGTRVRLSDTDARIVVENGVRYRVDPAGTRVRIDDQGLDLDVDLPDVDVGVNNKGNLDVDVTNNRSN